MGWWGPHSGQTVKPVQQYGLNWLCTLDLREVCKKYAPTLCTVVVQKCNKLGYHRSFQKLKLSLQARSLIQSLIHRLNSQGRHLIWFKFCFSVSMYTKANASQFERQILLWNFVLGCLSCLRIHMTNWKKTKCPAHLITIAVAINAVYEHCHSSLAWNGKQCDALTRLSPFKMMVPYKHIHQIKNWQPGLWIKHWVKLQAFKSDINLR